MRRVRELLRVSIVQRLLRGDVLPSEWELVSSYDTSRGVVREALDLLRAELELTLALCGCSSPAELTPSHVRRAPATSVYSG